MIPSGANPESTSTGPASRPSVRSISSPPSRPTDTSPFRAWCQLVWLSFRRQARASQMLWFAVILLALTTTVVVLISSSGRWSMNRWRRERPNGPTYKEDHSIHQVARLSILWSPYTGAMHDCLFVATESILEQSEFLVFSDRIVFTVFLAFLLPMWSLSFATEALGGEREARSLTWLLTRPLPRPAIYLALFVALLPWCLLLNLGGFAVLCLAAGRPGHLAFFMFWPAVLWGSLAFCSLFHLLSACFRRAAIIGIAYTFFLETILGSMPGQMKRISIGFYTRCMMFEKTQELGVQTQKSTVYLPLDATTSWWMLMAMTCVFLTLGSIVFARKEYQDLT